MQRRQVFVGEGPLEMAAAFDDQERMAKLGIRWIINVPSPCATTVSACSRSVARQSASVRPRSLWHGYSAWQRARASRWALASDKEPLMNEFDRLSTQIHELQGSLLAMECFVNSLTQSLERRRAPGRARLLRERIGGVSDRADEFDRARGDRRGVQARPAAGDCLARRSRTRPTDA